MLLADHSGLLKTLSLRTSLLLLLLNFNADDLLDRNLRYA